MTHRNIWTKDEREAHQNYVVENIYNYCFVWGHHNTFTSHILSGYCGLSSIMLGRTILPDLLQRGLIVVFSRNSRGNIRYGINRNKLLEGMQGGL